jgi:hypothetical protein
MIKLPIQFPDPLAEAARRAAEFQRLSPELRWREIASLMELGLEMARTSQRREWIKQRQEEQEAQWQRRQQELFAKHAG